MIKCTFGIWRLFSAGNALHFLEIHKVLPAKMCLFPTKNISPSALGELIIVYLNELCLLSIEGKYPPNPEAAQ